MAIDVASADALLHGMVRATPMEKVALWEAEGRILREPVKADASYPPFDRVCMDGFALRAEAVARGLRIFPVIGSAPAGHSPPVLRDPEACVEVMTGASMPPGSDSVIPVEQVIRDGDAIALNPNLEWRAGQHVHARGRDFQSGDILLEAGVRLGGAELAVAAAVGCSQLTVARRPRISLIVTGDELVPVNVHPNSAQIRMTHPYALRGLLHPWADLDWVHVGDNAETLRAAIVSARDQTEILLMTGGVSAGRLDLVPEALTALGAKASFHRVRQRPGQPLWVGSFGEQHGSKPIFAFPGNPVAVNVCARRYFLPWLWRCLGRNDSVPLRLPLGQAMKGLENKTHFVAVERRARKDGSWEAHPCRVQGSGDFAGLSGSHGFVELEAGRSRFEAEEMVPYYDWSFA